MAAPSDTKAPENTRDPLRDDLGKQVEGAKRALDQTRKDLSQQATELAGEAKDVLLEKSEDAKRGLSGSLQSLGGALRAAGDSLSQSGQPAPSKLFGEAASGLEQFARSLNDKPLGEVLDEVRTFGRNHSGSLFVGSVLAGLALSRVFKVVEEGGSDQGADTGGTPSGDRRDRNFGQDPGQPTPAGPASSSSGR